jgi:hypothetical protein
MRNATHEEHDGSSVEESACGIDGGLEVLCQAPVAPDPGEEPLDQPLYNVAKDREFYSALLIRVDHLVMESGR